MSKQKCNQPPTAEYLHEVFRYDEKTGQLFWKRRPRHHYRQPTGWGINAKLAGTRAGNAFQGKYRQVSLNGKAYYEHRIIYAMCTGVWPAMVDHLDGNGLNNRFENLVPSSYPENGKNLRRYANNKHGYTGIRPVGARWHAHITENGKQVHLGSFPGKAAAIRARRAAERRLGYSPLHGRPADSAPYREDSAA